MIVGDEVPDGKITLNVSWTNRSDAKALIARLRHMQTELRFLKQQLGADMASIRSDFLSKRTAVGKTLPNIVAGVIFGRRNVGRGNTLQRDILRREQVDAL